MLKALKPVDIEAIAAACEPDEPRLGGEPATDDARSAAERERVVYAIIERLPREAQEELLALMWTGGPKNGSSFADNLELAHKTWDENHATHIAEQHAGLVLYLKDGLKRMSAEQA